MTKTTLFFLVLFSSLSLSAQWQQASMNENGETTVHTIPTPNDVQFRGNTFNQIAGFPKGFIGNPSFKHRRNVTLADLNDDGLEDILFAADNQLFAYAHNELLWQKDIGATAVFSPSVADIDNDGELEIVQAVFGGIDRGRVYVMEKDGTDMPGWPKTFDQKITPSIALADLDNDDQMELVFGEIGGGGVQDVHVYRIDGTAVSDNWPIRLPARPAITPSIGDVDKDGELEIVAFTTEARYIFNLNGEAEEGWPIVTDSIVRFSWHSPILVDLDDDETLEIVGSSTGEIPEFFALNHDATYQANWQKPIPENTWSFSPPTVVEIDGALVILMSRPIMSEAADDMLYAWDAAGNMLDGFPIVKTGGCEGVISVADIDNDNDFEVLFTSNTVGADGKGFIHAYHMDGSGEVEGFPIRPHGWTYFNGVNLGDIDGDGQMDLTSLTYTQSFGAMTDSIYLHVYNLETPYAPEKILWNTYKGNNRRDGLPFPQIISNLDKVQENLSAQVFPNPFEQQAILTLNFLKKEALHIKVYDITGQYQATIFEGTLGIGQQELELNTKNWAVGIYFINIEQDNALVQSLKIVKK